MQLIVMLQIINGALSISIGTIALAHFSLDFLERLNMDMCGACLFLFFQVAVNGVVCAC